jgi:hypothetical protein
MTHTLNGSLLPKQLTTGSSALVLKALPALRTLRHEPRYQALFERTGLPEELRR